MHDQSLADGGGQFDFGTELVDPWRHTFDAVPDLIFLLDRKRTIRKINRAAAEHLGFEPEQAVGRRCCELFHGSGSPPDYCPFALLLLDGESHTVEYFEERFGIWFETTCSPVRDAAGQLVGAVHVARDISARKRAEEDRLQMTRQVQYAQKLESLGVLAGGIAHDFNNLLMTILGNADMALQGLSSSSRLRQPLLEIEKASLKAAELTRQMLAYSGKGRFIIKPLDLSHLLNEASTLLESSISKSNTLLLRLSPDLPAIEADPIQMQQVGMSLVINAGEALEGREGGQVRVATGVVACDREYLDQCLPVVWAQSGEGPQEGLYVYLEVADNGGGMARATQARIFDPFFSTKFTGRGLGLAAVLGIVRSHRGAIHLESEPGRGTTVRILFPALESHPAAQEQRQTVSTERWQGAGTVLLVDDEHWVRDVVQRMLKMRGFEVLTAPGGREAVDLLRQSPAEIVCVILDLTMPGLPCKETCAEMRRIKPGVKIVLTSGYRKSDISRRFTGDMVDDFLMKPYQSPELARMLKGLLDP